VAVSAHVISAVGRFLLKLKRLDKSTVKEYSVFVMNTVKAYEEVVDFIAAGTTPQNVIAFRPSEAAQERVEDLLARLATICRVSGLMRLLIRQEVTGAGFC